MVCCGVKKTGNNTLLEALLNVVKACIAAKLLSFDLMTSCLHSIRYSDLLASYISQIFAPFIFPIS